MGLQGVCDDTALAPGGHFTMLEITDNSMCPPHRLPLDHVPSDSLARRPKESPSARAAPRRAVTCSADNQQASRHCAALSHYARAGACTASYGASAMDDQRVTRGALSWLLLRRANAEQLAPALAREGQGH
jgi:hypothetical protein